MPSVDNLENAWKNNNIIFQKQLECNIKELNGNYPPHWNSIISF